MAEYGRYRIELDNEWSLEDLAYFPRTYEQVYFFFSSIDGSINDTDRERIARAYASFPWQGGYSAVSFFNQLRFATSRRGRPRILGIEKHSPGFLDLGLWVEVATSVATIVMSLALAVEKANTVYSKIYKEAQERKLLKLQEERTRFHFDSEQMNFILHSNKQLAKLLGLKDAAELNRLTGSPYITMKILLSVYRRVRTLCDYENKGKAHLTEGELSRLPRLPRKRATRREKGKTS